MVSNVLVAVFILVAVLVVWLRFKTRKVLKISRAIIIQTSPETLFPFINNPRLINEWNPFMDGDPSVRISYGDISEGTNATWSWEGKRAGIGTATIVKSEPYRNVVLRLDFKKPFHVTNHGSYELVPLENSAEIIWTIEETALIPRILSNFINLEKVIGGVFEKGLTKLKTLIEKKGSQK